jgi:tagatose 6-phosphate kinase
MLLTVTLNASVDKLYLLDENIPGTVMRVREVRNSAGGKGMNVSRVAAQLGEPVTAMGFVGGYTGKYFESLITQPLIARAFTHTSAEMRNCINCWDLSCARSTEYLETGAPVEEADVDRFIEDFAMRLPGADVVAISGSLPRGVPDDFYATLVRMCHNAGKAALLDASGAALRAALPATPDFIKPNASEMAALLGFEPRTREEQIEAITAYKRQGIACAALSLGAEGVLVACEEGVFHGEPPAIQPSNTVGCGDSMVAGFAVGMARELAITEQIRLAVAVATASALYIGTGDYAQGDFDAILPKVQVHRLQ